MSSREYFQGDARQDSYEFVGRDGPNPRGTSPYPPQGSAYGSQSHAQSQSPYSAGGYNAPAPPARYEPGPPSNYGGSPPPAYNQGYQSSPYGQQQQYGQPQYGQPQYGQRPQEYPEQARYGQQQNYGQNAPSTQYDGPGGAQEGDRGILGALGGAAAGGYGGHKMNHGVIGTIGGAVAGSMLEDHLRKPAHEEEKRRKEEEKRQHEWQKEEEKRRKHEQHHGGPPRPQGHNFVGNFSGSSSDISLDRDYDLIARCADMYGGHRLSSINLNQHLTNEFGTMKWQRDGNFGGSARNVRLADNGRVLEAELADGGGGWRYAFIHLDERITNENGELKYID